MDEEILDWVIEIYNEEDYCAWELDIKPAKHKFKEFRRQFNQNKINKTWCVYHWWYWCLIDNLWEIRDYDKDLLELDWLKEQYWYIQWTWMYVYKWVDMVRNWWNSKELDNPIITYRTTIWSDEFFKIIELWYSVHTWYKWNSKYNEDRKDWVLNWNEFGTATYWHSIRMTEEWKLEVVDNYLWRVDNVYEIKDIKWLVDNWVFFTFWYIYMFKNNIMTDLDKDIADIQFALDKGITKDSDVLVDIKKWNYTTKVQTLLMIIRANRVFNS